MRPTKQSILLKVVLKWGAFCALAFLSLKFLLYIHIYVYPFSFKVNPMFTVLSAVLSYLSHSMFLFLQVLYKHKIVLFGGFYDTLREVRLV